MEKRAQWHQEQERISVAKREGCSGGGDVVEGIREGKEGGAHPEGEKKKVFGRAGTLHMFLGSSLKNKGRKNIGSRETRPTGGTYCGNQNGIISPDSKSTFYSEKLLTSDATIAIKEKEGKPGAAAGVVVPY